MDSTAGSPVRLNRNNLHRRGRQRIVHIGVGAFHRAHQAVYLDDLLARVQLPEWEICGVGLLAPDQAIHTALVELSAAGHRARVIGSLLEHRCAPDSPETVIGRMAGPECRIVSLTITEPGHLAQEVEYVLPAEENVGEGSSKW